LFYAHDFSPTTRSYEQKSAGLEKGIFFILKTLAKINAYTYYTHSHISGSVFNHPAQPET